MKEWRKNFYCSVAERILKKKGKPPGFFARRNKYRAEMELEWNNARIWIEKRKDGIHIVWTPKGIKDNKLLLQFHIEDNNYVISAFDFNEVDINNYKKAFEKVL